MPSAKYVHTATTTRPIEDVWGRLQAASTWANIGPVEEVWDAVHDGENLKSYRWRTTVGPTSYRGTARLIAAEAPRRMELDLDGGELTGTLTTNLSANGDGTTVVEVTLHIVSRGMVSTLFFPVISEAVGRGLPAQVERFATSLSDE